MTIQGLGVILMLLSAWRLFSGLRMKTHDRFQIKIESQEFYRTRARDLVAGTIGLIGSLLILIMA